MNIEIVKKESTSLVQTGYDKTRNCGENRLKIEADSFPSSLMTTHDYEPFGLTFADRSSLASPGPPRKRPVGFVRHAWGEMNA